MSQQRLRMRFQAKLSHVMPRRTGTEIPKWIGSLTRLRTLIIWGNELQGKHSVLIHCTFLTKRAEAGTYRGSIAAVELTARRHTLARPCALHGYRCWRLRHHPYGSWTDQEGRVSLFEWCIYVDEMHALYRDFLAELIVPGRIRCGTRLI